MIRSLRYAILTLILLGAAFVLPYVITTSSARLLTVTALIWALLASSWNVVLGLGGIFSFAHLGIFGVGGYTFAIATTRLDLDGWSSLVIAILAGALAGCIALLPSLRLRGIYVGLASFLFVMACQYLVLAFPSITGGTSGMTGISHLRLGDFSFGSLNGLGYLWFVGALVALWTVWLVWFRHSPAGLGLIALRENRHLAASRGISERSLQMLAFIVSGAVAGLAGGLYVSYFRVADVSLFGLTVMTLCLSMIYLGGTTVVWGPVLGALIITFADNGMNGFGEWRAILLGLGTLAILLLFPSGISGLLAGGARKYRLRSDKVSEDSAGAPISRGSPDAIADNLSGSPRRHSRCWR